MSPDTAEGLSPTLIAAKQADWMQVILNQGPPCFRLEEGGHFCLRAERWTGHTDRDEYPEHRFVSLADLVERIASLAAQAQECVWTPFDDDWSGVRWETACGHAFVFIEDGPAENETNYCCYCGGKLAQAERPPEETR